MLLKILLVSCQDHPQLEACETLAARLRRDPDNRFAVTVATGLEEGRRAAFEGTHGKEFDVVIVDGFYSVEHGYGEGSKAAPFLDALHQAGRRYGRFLGAGGDIPRRYRGDFIISKPFPMRQGNGEDLEEKILAAVLCS